MRLNDEIQSKSKTLEAFVFFKDGKKVFFHEKINEFDYVNLNFAYF